MVAGKRFLGLLLAGMACATAEAGPVDELHAAAAGNDMDKLRMQVEQLAVLAKAEIAAKGVHRALGSFRSPPWKREANGLHMWGVNKDGLSWFDAGHPELEGLNVSEMSDMQGRNWSRLAIDSAAGTGEKFFEITFPHPVLKHAATGVHTCFPVENSERVLCAGAFLDGE